MSGVLARRLAPLADALSPLADRFAEAPGAVGGLACRLALSARFEREKAAAVEAFRAGLARLGPGDVALDLGANEGGVTARLAATGARVHAYEPDPVLAEGLRARFAGTPSVTVHAEAVGVRAGTVTLRRHRAYRRNTVKYGRANSIVEEAVATRGGEAIPVPCVSFREALDRVEGPIALVKMDIEGAEVAILEELLGTPALDRIGLLLVETHWRQMPALGKRIMRLHRRIEPRDRDRIHLSWP